MRAYVGLPLTPDHLRIAYVFRILFLCIWLFIYALGRRQMP